MSAADVAAPSSETEEDTGDEADSGARHFDAGAFRLESGEVLPEVRVAYRTWGQLSSSRDNAVLVCHALTGSADVDSWWADLLGPGRVLDPRFDFVVASNVLGSCYGTTGPTSTLPGTSRVWGPDFPRITVRDMVRLQARWLDALGVKRLSLVVGGSLGGMQALEWAALYPERVERAAALAVSGRHSAWAIGASAAQRAALEADSRFLGGRYSFDSPPAAGLAAARQIAMLFYRSFEELDRRFGRSRAADGRFAVESYLGHQGERLSERFDANSYLTLTRAMDSHDLGAGRGSYEAALAAIEVPVLVLSISSDGLYPPAEQEELARLLPRGELARIESVHGHDAFLIETAAVSRVLETFRQHQAMPAPPRATLRPLVFGGRR